MTESGGTAPPPSTPAAPAPYIELPSLPTSYPPNVPKGEAICPVLQGTRLLKGCNFEKAAAKYVGPAAPLNCPSGTFPDYQNGGECWSCPAGFIRNVSPVTADEACWKAV